MKIYDTLPAGFKIDTTAGSPKAGLVFINNGVNRLSPNHVTAFLRVEPKPAESPAYKLTSPEKPAKPIQNQEPRVE